MEGTTNMDSILSRFSNFSTERSKRVSANDDDDDDDDDEEEEDNTHQDDHDGKKDYENEEDDLKDAMMRDRDNDYSHSPKPYASVIVPEEPLVQEFVDSSYWKVIKFKFN